MYPIKYCPHCGSEILHSTESTITCKCGVHSLLAAMSLIYRLPEPYLVELIKTPVAEPQMAGIVSSIQVNKIYYCLNVLDYTGGLQELDVPSIYSHEALNELPGAVTLTDSIAILRESVAEKATDVVYYTKEWVPRWNELFSGKHVNVVIGESEVIARSIARQLTNHKCFVRIGYQRETLEETLAEMAPLIVNPIQDSLTISCKKGKDLKEIIDSYHKVHTRNGFRYMASINVPLRLIIQDVIQWFKDNGADFIWDVENDQGYMLYNKELYCMKPYDGALKSLLWAVGGITSANSEGRGIIEGLCAMKSESLQLRPEPWIKANIYKNEIEVRQGSTSIILSPKSVVESHEVKLSYDLIRHQKRWFHAVDYTEEDGLPLLFKEIANYFAVDPVAREIILAWLISIFLKDYSTIRPGIRITGPPSGGKSTVLQLLNWLFYGGEDSNLTSEPTIAGLWRLASVEPFIPLDNKNVRELDESLRTFLDVCAYAGKRPIGVSGTTNEFREQKTDSFVMISGLDSFLHHDVRTRYIEIEASAEFKTRFYPPIRKAVIFRNRDAIFSSIFRMLAFDVLPFLDDFINEEMCDKYRILLDTKERIVDYFLIMLCVGSAMQRRGIIPSGDLGARWTDYIRSRSSRADVKNAVTIEWWNNFRIALVRENVLMTFPIEGMNIKEEYKFVRKDGRVCGLRGTIEELLNAIAWTAGVLRRKLPWSNVRDFQVAHKIDSKAWDALGWSMEKEGSEYVIKWKEGI